MIINSVYTKCSKCEARYSYTDILSENTSGAEIWSDGFCLAPIRKEILEFSVCPSCKTFFWLKENSIDKPQDLTEIKILENFWVLDIIGQKEIDFIKAAFRFGLAATPEKEILLRIKLWHVINHTIRKYDTLGFFQKIKQKIFETSEFKDSHKLYNYSLSLKLNNLIRLSNLLKMDKNENDNFLLFAEIYREMGDFSKAMIFCHKAETTSRIDTSRILLLKQHITNKSKAAYRL